MEQAAVEVRANELVFRAPDDALYNLESAARRLATLAEQLLARRVLVRVVAASEPAAAPPAASHAKPPNGKDGKDEPTARAMAHPQVQRFLAVFGGQVREVRDLKETES